MHTVHLPHVNAFADWRERYWIARVLAEHHVREDVVRLLMRRCTFVVEDWQHDNGGGGCTAATAPARIRVRLNGPQAEAALHECAHAFRHVLIGERSWFGPQLITAWLAETEMAQGDYPLIRRLCRDYRWGIGDWPGMWMEDEQRWNESEIWAGLASGSMGDLRLYPPRLRSLYGQYYADGLPTAAAVVVTSI